MNEQIVQLKTWWMAQGAREKKVAKVGCLLIAFLLFYLVIWAPFLDRVALMRKNIMTETKTLLWMQAADVKIQTFLQQKKGGRVSGVLLLPLLQKQLAQQGFGDHLAGLKQSSDETIEIHFQGVSFDRLMKFLSEATKRYRLSITSFSAVAQGASGMVNADVVVG